MRTEKRATPRRCNYNGAEMLVLWSSDHILPNEWTPEKCRAIEIAMGGGWLLMAVLAVIA